MKVSFHNYASNEYRNNSEHVIIKKLVNIMMGISKNFIFYFYFYFHLFILYVIYKKLKLNSS